MHFFRRTLSPNPSSLADVCMMAEADHNTPVILVGNKVLISSCQTVYNSVFTLMENLRQAKQTKRAQTPRVEFVSKHYIQLFFNPLVLYLPCAYQSENIFTRQG